LLGRDIEIDQQVAAEHEIILTIAAGQRWVEHVANLQIHLLQYPLVQLVAVIILTEMPLAKPKFSAAERVAPVDALYALGHRDRADIDTVDTEIGRAHTRIEQGHGQRIWLLTGGARQAEQAQGPLAGQLGQALLGQPDQRGERVRITEEPGFRDDHRLDQRQLLIRRLLQANPVVTQIGGIQGDATLAQGPLHHRHTNRLDIQADTFLQEAEETLLAHGVTCSGACGNNSSRTRSVSRSSTSIRCSKPWASWRTGPK